MLIKPFPSGPLSTNAYLVICPSTQESAIVDPSPESSAKIIDYIEKNQLIPVKILLTHSHWDHIAEVAVLKNKYELPVYVHADDAGNLERPGSDNIPCWLNIPSIHPDYLIKDREHIQVGTLDLTVIHTPGHTPGGVCFYCPQEKFLLSGDTLFKGTIGNVNFSTGNPELMWLSLKKLATLPSETLVYPGHGPKTTIGNEPWLSNAEDLFG